MICGVVFQHQDLSIVFNAVQNGVVVETGHAMVDELLTRGGLMSDVDGFPYSSAACHSAWYTGMYRHDE